MKQKINSILLQCHSSLVGGIDIAKAVEALDEYFEDEYRKLSDRITDSCELQLVERYSIEESLEWVIEENEKLIYPFEEDMELSNSLLIEFIPILKAYKDIMSNHPIKHQELSTLLFKVEEQIIKNGK